MPKSKEPAISASFVSHLRQASRVTCPVPECSEAFAAIDDRIREHLTSKHSEYIEGKDLKALIADVKRGRSGRMPGHPVAAEPAGLSRVPPSTRDPGGGFSSGLTGTTADAGPSSHGRRRSPNRQTRPHSASPPRRSRARPQHNTALNDPDFIPRSTHQGKLWNPDQGSAASPYKAKSGLTTTPNPSATPQVDDTPEEEDSTAHELIRQPETRSISQEQLVAEVKGIYTGLMMVESKCIEVDNAQSSQTDVTLNNEQWQALIALHRTLLHEHHDFFLASQHPSASDALKRLASKYAMPARMWRHGIHSFLELLRHRLPVSLEHMLTFIYLAYSMMALLYETVPAFEDTWIECLGDLARYRMAIEEDDIRDREAWTSVSRHWYSKASDKAPTTGRLYHHLAILARPNALQQLFYYFKSLCVLIPFPSTKESIMTLFNPALDSNTKHTSHLPPPDVAFVKAHGILFSHKQLDEYSRVVSDFLKLLDSHINRLGKCWTEPGYYIAIANCCALSSYGNKENVIMRSVHSQGDEEQDPSAGPATGNLKLMKNFEDALHLTIETHKIVFRRREDANVLSYTHVVMVFMLYLSRLPNFADQQLQRRFPWKLLSLLLNYLLSSYSEHDRIYSNDFPREEGNPPRAPHPLPEDFALKGLFFVDNYHPADWFLNDKIDDDEKFFEMASMTNVRIERILWLGYQIAQLQKGLLYSKDEKSFGVLPEYEQDIEGISEDVAMTNISDAPHIEPETQGDGDAMDIDESPAPTTANKTS
ncbi:hypothetical protein F4777DRAFT_585149 [Nemania sp. FL0916]|nr:hypothetical protein F4777DRAFT_585149 [Nemania sp. FL0916]